MSERYRDAASGHYVSEEYAKQNPDTTVKETMDDKDELIVELRARIRELEDRVAHLEEKNSDLSWQVQNATR